MSNDSELGVLSADEMGARFLRNGQGDLDFIGPRSGVAFKGKLGTVSVRPKRFRMRLLHSRTSVFPGINGIAISAKPPTEHPSPFRYAMYSCLQPQHTSA